MVGMLDDKGEEYKVEQNCSLYGKVKKRKRKRPGSHNPLQKHDPNDLKTSH
jgi:hypothetical protein